MKSKNGSASEANISSRRTLLKATAFSAAALSLANVSASQSSKIGNNARLDDLIQANQTIARARQIALDILKPSQKQMEHGLKLHAESLVFDGYAFSPRTSTDPVIIAKMMEDGASEVELQDATEDMGMTRAVTNLREREELMMAFRASGVTCIYQNAGEECQHPQRLIKRLARFTFLTDMLKPFLTKATTPNDIDLVKKDGGHCLYLTGNGVPLPQDWISVEEELRTIRVFFHLGIRMMHVTYQRRNMLGDGCAETANGGLSDFGRQAIAEMNRQGVLVDIAHSGWQTSLEAAKVSTKPVVASHTTAAGLHHHIRSKPDEVLKALADSGGYAGICCISQFLGGKCDINAFLDHIDYVVKKIGIDHVAIGTDVAYSSRPNGNNSIKLPPRRKSRARFASLWPKETLTATESARESIAWTNWPLFTVGLVQRGYRDDDVKKIIGGNVMRVAKAVFPTYPPLA
ncbi:MAG: membrane dipeptidase [Gemmataceae bacterium]|nr:membrane dipeptidase [Gemmataceae bacterium]